MTHFLSMIGVIFSHGLGICLAVITLSSSLDPSIGVILVLQCISLESVSNTLGPVVQSVVSLTSSLRVISLTVLADLIHSILIFFAEKM